MVMALNRCLGDQSRDTRPNADKRTSGDAHLLPFWKVGGAHSVSVAREAYSHALEALEKRPQAAVALSVSIPFCASHCLCCDRDIHAAQANAVVEDYVETLIAEFETLARQVGGRRDIWQLHLGGGSATELDESHLARLIHALERHWRLPADAEVSVECDPRRVSERKLQLLDALGFGHIIFEIFDLNPAVQRAIGRLQSKALIDDACDMARRAGFETITLEVMAGLPEQAPTVWQATIQRLLELAPDRVRVGRYQHRPDRSPGQFAIDARNLPSPAESESLVAQAADMLCEAGYRWLGTDLFVLETDRLAQAFDTGELRRNLLSFSHRPPAPTLALGMGAASEIDGHIFRNDTSLGGWRAAVRSGTLPVGQAQLARQDMMRRRKAAERMLCSLEFPAALAREGLESAYQRIASHARDGLVRIHDDRLSITHAGQHALAVLCAELLDPG